MRPVSLPWRCCVLAVVSCRVVDTAPAARRCELESLTIWGGEDALELTPSFAPWNLSYAAGLDYHQQPLWVDPTAHVHCDARRSDAGGAIIAGGSGEIRVAVAGPPDWEPLEYSVLVMRRTGNENTLVSLAVSGGARLSAAFSPAVKTYAAGLTPAALSNWTSAATALLAVEVVPLDKGQRIEIVSLKSLSPAASRRLAPWDWLWPKSSASSAAAPSTGSSSNFAASPAISSSSAASMAPKASQAPAPRHRPPRVLPIGRLIGIVRADSPDPQWAVRRSRGQADVVLPAKIVVQVWPASAERDEDGRSTKYTVTLRASGPVPAGAVVKCRGCPAVMKRSVPTVAPRSTVTTTMKREGHVVVSSVLVRMTVANMSYNLLTSIAKPSAAGVRSSFEHAIRSEIAAAAGEGITSGQVSIQLSAGSVIVVAKIELPEDVQVTTVEAALLQHPPDIVSRINAIEGIEDTSIGTISVEGMTVDGQPVVIPQAQSDQSSGEWIFISVAVVVALALLLWFLPIPWGLLFTSSSSPARGVGLGPSSGLMATPPPPPVRRVPLEGEQKILAEGDAALLRAVINVS